MANLANKFCVRTQRSCFLQGRKKDLCGRTVGGTKRGNDGELAADSAMALKALLRVVCSSWICNQGNDRIKQFLHIVFQCGLE